MAAAGSVPPCRYTARPKSLTRVLKLVTKRRKYQLLSIVEELSQVALRTEGSGLLERAPRASALGLEPLTPRSEEFFRQMITLRLPEDAPKDLQECLNGEHRIEGLVGERGEERFIRISFQGYNDAADLERLKSALDDLLAS